MQRKARFGLDRAIAGRERRGEDRLLREELSAHPRPLGALTGEHEHHPRRAPDPRAAVFDSRTLQSSPESGGRAGYDGAKRRKGSKVHLAVDTLGQMWATSAMGIQVCEQPGRCTNILNKPEFTSTPVASIAFGGPNRAWLYVTQGGKIFRRETRRTGVVAWELVKPPQPGL